MAGLYVTANVNNNSILPIILLIVWEHFFNANLLTFNVSQESLRSKVFLQKDWFASFTDIRQDIICLQFCIFTKNSWKSLFYKIMFYKVGGRPLLVPSSQDMTSLCLQEELVEKQQNWWHFLHFNNSLTFSIQSVKNCFVHFELVKR